MRRLATLILSLWGIALSHAALEVPKALPATDITENSFTANWQSVSQASAYNLNVFAYKMEDCGTETVKVTESFEGLVPRSSGSKQNKYIDSNLSVFPENWKIDVNAGSIRQLYTTNVARRYHICLFGENSSCIRCHRRFDCYPCITGPRLEIFVLDKKRPMPPEQSQFTDLTAFNGTLLVKPQQSVIEVEE